MARRRTAGALPAPVDEAVAALLRAFQEAAAELSEELVRIVEIVALDPDATVRYRGEQIRGLLTRIRFAAAELDGASLAFAEQTLSRIYAAGMAVAVEASGGSAAFTLVHREALEMIALDTYNDLAAATQYLEPSVKRVIREAVKARNALSASAGTSVQTDVRALVRLLNERGVGAFIDSAGREWALDTYAEMVVRTKSAQAYNTATVLKAEETGTTAFEIRDGERSGHEACVRYSGKTCTPKWALEHPIEHPNCVRGFGPLPLHRGGVDLGDSGLASNDVTAEAQRRRDAGELPSDLSLAF